MPDNITLPEVRKAGDPPYGAGELNQHRNATLKSHVNNTVGLGMTQGPSGTTIGNRVVSGDPVEPAIQVRMANTGTIEIGIYDPVAITGHFLSNQSGGLTERIFTVRTPTPTDKVFGVAKDPIPVDEEAAGWIDGSCPLNIQRRFDGVSSLLNHVYPVPGESYAVESLYGHFEIIAEEDFTGEETHVAIVNITGPRLMEFDFSNEQATAIPHGGPAIFDDAAAESVFELESPDTDNEDNLFVNIVPESLAQSAFGRMAIASGILMVQVDAVVGLGDSLVAASGNALFEVTTSSKKHLIVQAYLGITNAGEHFAIARRVPAASPGWFLARVTTQATGTALVCSIFENGFSEGATITGQSVSFPMIGSTRKTAVDTFGMVREKDDSTWEGFIPTIAPTPT